MFYKSEHIALCLTFGFTFVVVTESGEVDEEWRAWKLRHGFGYKNDLEEKKRYDAFQQNRAFVATNNMKRMETGFSVELNQFADMTPAEIENNLLTLKVPNSSNSHWNQQISADDDPDVQPYYFDQATTPLYPDFRTTEKETITITEIYTTSTITTTWSTVTSSTFTTPLPTTKSSRRPTTKRTTTTSKPEHLDWREQGAVTQVKNQTKRCGSCWAFSVTGAIEGRLKIKTGKLISLSEQNLLDCSRYGNFGCDGGWMNDAMMYVRDTGGLNTEESYPYKAVQGNCRFNDKPNAKFGALHVKIFNWVQPQSDEALMKALEGGPVISGVDARRRSFLFYKSGIYGDKACTTNTNHAILIVGYGRDEATDKPYWVIKNSWGERWGEKGYMRMARDRNTNICGLLNNLTYPVLL